MDTVSLCFILSEYMRGTSDICHLCSPTFAMVQPYVRAATHMHAINKMRERFALEAEFLEGLHEACFNKCHC
jgi:hypothetical protein